MWNLKKKQEEKKKKEAEDKKNGGKGDKGKTDKGKTGMKEITKTNPKSTGELFLTREMPEIESELKTNVPQARLIRHGREVMNFDVEYTPDQSSYWHGGKYVFSFTFPDEFPNKPPKVMCKTKIYHPNIDYDGNVCLNMLKEDWNPTYTGLSCIAGVYQLFVEPNPNDPLNHEVAKLMRDNKEQFKENVKRTLRGGYQFGQDFPRFKKY